MQTNRVISTCHQKLPSVPQQIQLLVINSPSDESLTNGGLDYVQRHRRLCNNHNYQLGPHKLPSSYKTGEPEAVM